MDYPSSGFLVLPEKNPIPVALETIFMWGIDTSSHQGILPMKQIKSEGFGFHIQKASEGTYYPNSLQVGYRDVARANVKNALAAGMISGYYHWLTNGDTKKQVDNFLRTTGENLEGKLVAIDVEHEPYPEVDYDPRSSDVKEFVLELRRRVGPHPIIIYCADWYWNGYMHAPTLKELFPNLEIGVDIIPWDAEYVTPREGYAARVWPNPLIQGGGKWDIRWGGAKHLILQFTDSAWVAGRAMDANRAIVAPSTMEKWTVAKEPPLPDEPVDPVDPGLCPCCGQPLPVLPWEPEEPAEPDRPKILAHGVVDGTNFSIGYKRLMRLKDHMRYEVWQGGNVPEGAMAWAANRILPLVAEMMGQTCACMGVPNIIRRDAGKIIPTRGLSQFDGGVAAYWRTQANFGFGPLGPGFFHEVEEPFDLETAKKWAKESGSGVLIGRSYRNATLPGQGHLSTLLPDGKVLQSFLFGNNGEPGLNDHYTIEESHAGGFYEWMVHPDDWINHNKNSWKTVTNHPSTISMDRLPEGWKATSSAGHISTHARYVGKHQVGDTLDKEEREVGKPHKKKDGYERRKKGDLSDKVKWGGLASLGAAAILGYIESTYGLPAPPGTDVFLAGVIVSLAGGVAGYLKRERR